MGRHTGFTLIEVVVAVTIVGILAAIAVPAYQQYTLRAKRVDATATLLRIQSAQERFYLNNNAYATSTAALGITETENGYYTLAISAETPTTGYTATATATGGQLNDSDCRVFTVNEQGARTSVDAGGAASTDVCWR